MMWTRIFRWLDAPCPTVWHTLPRAIVVGCLPVLGFLLPLAVMRLFSFFREVFP